MIRKCFLAIAMIFSLCATQNVGVFCSADDQIPDMYKEKAFELGQALQRSDLGLVTGGCNSGLMKEVVDGFVFKQGSGHLYGIIPSVFKNYNVHHAEIHEENLVWVDGLHSRLEYFHEACDAIVVMPGGFGTLHELMDFMVLRQWGLNEKKIILLNLDHYWDHLLLQFEEMVEKKALKQKHLDLLSVVFTVEDCIEAIKAAATEHPGLNDRYWERN